MFGKLKEKLNGWLKSSKEKIEETAAVTETEDVKDKEIEKAEKIIEKAKDDPAEKVPGRFDLARRKYEPDLEKVKEEAENIKQEIDSAKKKEKDIKDFEEEFDKADKLIEDSKNESTSEIPVKFNVGLEKFEPDLERVKEEAEGKIENQLTAELEGKEVPVKKGFLSKIKSSLSYKISEEEFNEIFEDLEMLLLENNVALDTVDDIKKTLANNLIGKEIKKNELETKIKEELKKTLNEILIEPDNPLDIIKLSEKPFKIIFFGVNGTGKTTSIAKIANFLIMAKFSVVLAAGDTFRAASIEQISEHANKLGVKLIKHDYGADPAAVGFDAIKYAENHKIDVVLIDTAGRMHTKSNLLSEMDKIVRVTDPHLKIFVAESIAGNDAIEQAKAFNEKIGIDGTILSKADIDEKGGTVISISHAIGKPIFYLGTGQKYDDLELFNKQKFLEGLGL